MTSQAIVSYFDIFKTFSIFTQYMSVSHGYSTICGIEWWLWRRQKEGKIVSHQLGISTGYGDANTRNQQHYFSLCRYQIGSGTSLAWSSLQDYPGPDQAMILFG